MLRIIFILLLLIVQFPVSAQDNILDRYIREGLQSNLIAQQKDLSFESAMNALQQAKSLYLPSVDFQTQYTTSNGGRNIDLPVGDMLNPVYATLNQMTGQSSFPQIKNERINFLPRNYYDARFRVTVPVLNTDLNHNTRIKEKQVAISKDEADIYRRELVKEIKVTYYSYLSALKAADIYRSAIALAEEGKRTNEKLIEAGKGLYAYVMRAETEIAQAQSQLTNIELQAKTISRYFNALLNRPADAEIEYTEATQEIDFKNMTDASAAGREELDILKKAISLQEDLVRMNQQAFVPGLNGFADFGSQAEQLRFNNQSLYFMIGLQLNIPIFSGNRNRLKIQEAKNDADLARLRRDNVEQQLDVAVTRASNEMLSAQSNYRTSLKQAETAATYFRLIDKGYASGVNSYIETVDARTQLTTAKIAVAINYYKLLSAMAVLERETASYPLSDIEMN